MTTRIDPREVDGLPAGSVGDLTDVDTTTTPPATGDLLEWDGSVWVPTDTISGGTP